MSPFVRLTLVLAFVAMAAAGALGMTYRVTKDQIRAQERLQKEKALKQGIFFRLDSFVTKPLNANKSVLAVYLQEGDARPAYYAAEGSATGYNTSVPLKVLVGFTHPDANVPEQNGKTGHVVVSWVVVKSEETPGLGENAKNRTAANTWLQGGLFAATPEGFDSRNTFQKQTAGLTVDELTLAKDGGPIDGITAATITSRGILDAIRDAKTNLDKALREAGAASDIP